MNHKFLQKYYEKKYQEFKYHNENAYKNIPGVGEEGIENLRKQLYLLLSKYGDFSKCDCYDMLMAIKALSMGICIEGNKSAYHYYNNIMVKIASEKEKK